MQITKIDVECLSVLAMLKKHFSWTFTFSRVSSYNKANWFLHSAWKTKRSTKYEISIKNCVSSRQSCLFRLSHIRLIFGNDLKLGKCLLFCCAGSVLESGKANFVSTNSSTTEQFNRIFTVKDEIVALQYSCSGQVQQTNKKQKLQHFWKFQ